MQSLIFFFLQSQNDKTLAAVLLVSAHAQLMLQIIQAWINMDKNNGAVCTNLSPASTTSPSSS